MAGVLWSRKPGEFKRQRGIAAWVRNFADSAPEIFRRQCPPTLGRPPIWFHHLGDRRHPPFARRQFPPPRDRHATTVRPSPAPTRRQILRAISHLRRVDDKTHFQPQRGCVLQPRVARHALPWVTVSKQNQPQRGCGKGTTCDTPNGAIQASTAQRPENHVPNNPMSIHIRPYLPANKHQSRPAPIKIDKSAS